MNLDHLKMLGNWVLLERDQSTTYKFLSVPDSFKNASPMARVLKVGPNVPEMIFPGDYVFVKSFNRWKKAHAITDSKTGVPCYIAPWIDIEGRVFEGKLIPIGRRILVKRVMSDHKLSDVIFSRDYNKENVQGLEVEIVRIGMSLEGDEFRHIKGLRSGDRCKLQGWEQHMTEVGILGEYHLIVNEKDLQYKYEDN